jgi:outer membrane protein assembly factor BamB
MSQRIRVFPLALLLAAAAACGAERTTVLARVRQQAGAALSSLQSEMKSWVAAVRTQVTNLRTSVDQGAQGVTQAGRQSVTELSNTASLLGRQASQQVHSGLTFAARELVPVGEAGGAKPEAAVTAFVATPIAEPGFLRQNDIAVAWNTTTGGRPIRRSLLLDDNLLLENAANDLYALDPLNGIADWIFPLPGASMYDYDTDEKSIVVVVDDVLYELDRDVGLPRRRTILPFPSSAQPYILGDSLIFASAEDRIYSLNRETRVREWSYLATSHIAAGLAARVNTVYYAQTNGKVFAYQPGSRKPQWDYEADDAIVVSLVVDGDNLYFPADDLFVHALNRLGGFRVWKFPTRGKVTQPIWVTKDTVGFAANGDGFYLVDRTKGQQLLYVQGAGWPVAVGQKNLYLEGPDQTILCVNRTTGKEVWRVSAKPFTCFVRNTDTDHIYLVTDQGQVYSFYLRGDHIERKVKEGPKPGVPKGLPGEEPGVPSAKGAPKLTPKIAPKPAPKKAAPAEKEGVGEGEKEKVEPAEPEVQPKVKAKTKAKAKAAEEGIEEEEPAPKKAAKEEVLDDETKKAREALEKAVEAEPKDDGAKDDGAKDEKEEAPPAKKKAAKAAEKGADDF